MNGRPIAFGGGAGGWQWPWRRHLRRRGGDQQRCAASSSGASSRGSYIDRVKGWQGPWKAALTSGSLSATGDLLAQALQARSRKPGEQAQYDPARTLRMFGFGLFIYGPLQFYWYNLLDFLMPVKTTQTFLAKVAANQLLLAPVTVSTVLSWNLAWTGKADHIPDKLRTDMLPTMQNGWKFWVPAASINFFAIPLQYQVLYMSTCGVLWTAYLSYASSTRVAAAPSVAPALPPPASSVGTKARK